VRSGPGRTPIQSIDIGRLLGSRLAGDHHRWRCAGDHARGDSRWGSLMRHFLASAAIPGLAGRVVKVTRAAPLIAPAGLAQGPLPRVGRTRRRAVPLAPVTPPAQEELLTTVQSATDHQPQRIHAPPRAQAAGAGQSRAGVRRRERRVARSHRVIRQRVRGGQTPNPHPSAPSAGPLYLNSSRLRN